MVSATIKALIPRSWYSRLKRTLLPCFCPLCDNASERFLPFGVVRRDAALCIYCGSLERHRLIWLYFQQKTDLFDERPKRMLHIAPEGWLSSRVSGYASINYLSGDLEPGRAMVQMDITDIQYPDSHFDIVYCSHVLEHVPDDRRAMCELHRVLALSGWAILQVPMREVATTYEDFAITTPEEREKHFGQQDHVRWYGRDYLDRLEAAGFNVTIDRFAESFSPKQAARFGIWRNEEIYLCHKQA